MKHIFRFFRGELNGFLIKTLCTFLNNYCITQGVIAELCYAFVSQWTSVINMTPDYIALRGEDVRGISLIGGLFPLNAYFGMNIGSVWFTEATKGWNNNIEVSERGLFEPEYAEWMFVRRDGSDKWPTDITTEATPGQLASGSPQGARLITYVMHGAEVQGYVRADTPLFDDAGNIIWSNVMSSPPSGVAYIEWYGLKYLHYEEMFTSDQQLPLDVSKPLFERLQSVRRYGVSLKALLDITWILGQGYIYNLTFTPNNWWFDVTYSLNSDVEFPERERSYAAWAVVMDMKFKEFVFTRVAPPGV